MAWIDAGNGSNAQLATVLGIGRETTVGNLHALPHDIFRAGLPVIVLWAGSKNFHLQPGVDIVVGFRPTRHALICETVTQLIMV